MLEKLHDYEIELLEHATGALKDDQVVAIKCGTLREILRTANPTGVVETFRTELREIEEELASLCNAVSRLKEEFDGVKND